MNVIRNKYGDIYWWNKKVFKEESAFEILATDVFEDNGTKKNKKTLTGVSTYLGILKYYEKNGYTITKEIVMPLSIQNTAMYSYMLYIKKEE